MKNKFFAAALVAFASIFLFSCQDDLSSQGSSLVKGEVTIIVDSIPTHISAHSVDYTAYDARSVNKLLGRISVPQYGSLSCSFLSQLYPSPELGINDSIPLEAIDSMKMVIQVPRGSLTGDSLAPQQLKVYRLDKQLPGDITNNADPEDYFNRRDPRSLIGTESYTLSVLSKNDTALKNDKHVYIRVRFPQEMAVDCVKKYRTDPSIFQWPSTFAQSYPGIYVEQNFGNGCIGNISYFGIFVYYNYPKQVSSKDSETGETVTTSVAHRDSVCLFTGSPEVVSSNVINLKMDENLRNLAASGKSLITTPGGYYTDIDFPAQEIIDKFNANSSRLTVISNLSMEVPAQEIKNDHGIGVAPYLLMVKKSEREDFFRQNKLPDGITAFYAPYNEEKKSYSFVTLRQYILSLLEANKELTAEDTEYSLIPVDIDSETVENYGTSTTYVTRCSNYIAKPTMTLLDTDNAIINFTYSKTEVE